MHVSKDITKKPFSTVGTLVFRDGEAKLIPSCIMCGKVLQNESYITGVWKWEDHKRDFIYFICDDCSKEHSAEEFEGKITFYVEGTRPRTKT